VSLYNETDGVGIYPTPSVAIVGLVPDIERTVGSAFQQAGDRIALLGTTRGELGGSEYLQMVTGLTSGSPPTLDLAAELRLQRLVRALIRSQLLHSAHDCSEGGLAVALAESCIMSAPRGARVALPPHARPDALLFGEDASRVLVSASPQHAAEIEKAAAGEGVPLAWIGEVGGDRIAVEGLLDVDLRDAERVWRTGLTRALWPSSATGANR
jgi:phosphoribosylformylglycinamidine synthase